MDYQRTSDGVVVVSVEVRMVPVEAILIYGGEAVCEVGVGEDGILRPNNKLHIKGIESIVID